MCAESASDQIDRAVRKCSIALSLRPRFSSNNAPGPSSGIGIYSDQFVAGGAIGNVLIDSNGFDDNASAGVYLSNTAATPFWNIQIVDNTFDANGNGISAITTTGLTIQGNAFSDSTGSTILLSGVTASSIVGKWGRSDCSRRG